MSSTITYELHIPPANEQAILDSLRASGYRPVNDWVENRNYVYVFSVEQPDDFYILVHNLLRQGRIVRCTARIEEGEN